jgi:hypothetical protein
MRTHRMNSVVNAAAGLVLAAALAGCSPDEEATAPVQTTSTTALTSPSTTTVEQEALNAYQEFWDGYLEAADPMNPEHPVLEQVATGDQLRQLRSAFLARLSAGEVIRGELETAPVVVEVSGEAATVRDCYLDRTGVFDAATGARKDAETGVRHLVNVRLVQEASTWKVASITREGEGCTPAASS